MQPEPLSSDWRRFVEDILDAVARIRSYVGVMDFDTFEANSLVVDAVSYRFIVIGEAVNQIPPVIQSRASAISWKRMRDMRNIVAHNYRGVDTEIIWATIADDFDPLVQQLQALLDSDDPTPAT